MRTYYPNNYEISKHRYMELLNLCKQYDELKQKRDACYGVGSPVLSDIPKGGANVSIVERQADAAARYAQKIELIESVAFRASEGSKVMFKCLIQNITRGTAYEHLNCPCARNTFYSMRRRFFWLLDKEV